MYSRDELFQRSRESYFGVYCPSCEAMREINNKIALEWALKQFVTRVHTLFYFLLDITDPKMMMKTTIFTHHPVVSLALLSFCWWRHNRLLMTSQWPDNCDTITWIVISNSLNIDFIHGDIHGRSCKKTSKLCVTGLCAGNSSGTGEFPAQMASNAENVSIWWRHHAYAISHKIVATEFGT